MNAAGAAEAERTEGAVLNDGFDATGLQGNALRLDVRRDGIRDLLHTVLIELQRVDIAAFRLRAGRCAAQHELIGKVNELCRVHSRFRACGDGVSRRIAERVAGKVNCRAVFAHAANVLTGDLLPVEAERIVDHDRAAVRRKRDVRRITLPFAACAPGLQQTEQIVRHALAVCGLSGRDGVAHLLRKLRQLAAVLHTRLCIQRQRIHGR